MLYDLIVKRHPADIKIDLLIKEYGINMKDHERGIDTMCNLSQGLIGQGIEQGIEQGKIIEHINIRKEDSYGEQDIINSLIKRFNLTSTQAKKILSENS